MSKETGLIKALSEFLSKYLDDNSADENVEVVKKLDEEQRKATFVVMKAYDGVDEYDLHEDTWDTSEIEKARESFKSECGQINLEHMFMVDESVAEIDEDYITISDIQIEDELIRKGSWIQTWKFNDESIWNDVKTGHWCGLSIQCRAKEEILIDS